MQPDDLLDTFARLVARHVARELRSDDHVDQRTSPLGSRRHITACRNGHIRGAALLGRRWVASREAVESYMASLGERPVAPQSDLAAELGLRLVSDG